LITVDNLPPIENRPLCTEQADFQPAADFQSAPHESYHSSVRFGLAIFLLLAPLVLAQDSDQKQDGTKAEPQYDDTFSGPIVELTASKIIISRSILGKPAEKRTFVIKVDTRIEGKLHVRAKVTIGFITTDEGDVARLIVVRGPQRPPEKSKK
jgi:hypothetical protein